MTWTTRFSDGNRTQQYSITGNRDTLGTFELSDLARATRPKRAGTEVEICGFTKNFRSLTDPRAAQEITELFALYLREYPGVKIVYDGTDIDPKTAEDHVEDYPLDPITLDDGRSIGATLTIIEWRKTTERALYLCDEAGFSLTEIPPGIQAPRFNFTAYLKSSFLRELDDLGSLALEELHPDLKKLLDAAKEKLREHFRRRSAEGASDLVESWKKDNIYPFENEPADVVERAERQVFDVIALNVNAFLPDFDKVDARNKRFSFRLLRQALEESPSAVQRILQEVLELPKEKQEEFAQLLEKTSLAAIINASKTVTDRLDFLKGLELLVFDAESKQKLLERRQLHRILVNHTWIFGEEFNMTVDDKSLTEVLKKHLQLLGREPEPLDPVIREDGTTGIVDLMLSRLVPQPKADDREHLVVELKRPGQPIDASVATQIKGYAIAVAEDERFRDTNTRWTFWALSNEIAPSVRREARQRNRPEGLLIDDDELRFTVWVKTWGQVLEACRARLQFFQQHLNYAATESSAIAFLQETHNRYLPKKFKK